MSTPANLKRCDDGFFPAGDQTEHRGPRCPGSTELTGLDDRKRSPVAWMLQTHWQAVASGCKQYWDGRGRLGRHCDDVQVRVTSRTRDCACDHHAMTRRSELRGSGRPGAAGPSASGPWTRRTRIMILRRLTVTGSGPGVTVVTCQCQCSAGTGRPEPTGPRRLQLQVSLVA